MLVIIPIAIICFFHKIKKWLGDTPIDDGGVDNWMKIDL